MGVGVHCDALPEGSPVASGCETPPKRLRVKNPRSPVAIGVPASLYFHAGDVATHEAPPRDEAAAGQPPPRDAVTVTALLIGVPDGDTVATTPRALREAASTTGGVWATIDALAAAATDSGGTARYRLAAAAAAKVDSFIEPTPHGPEFVRLGVRSERRANASTSARAPAATSLAARVAAVVAETRLLQTMLEEAAACPDDASRKLYRRCDTNQHPPQPIAVRRTSGRCSLDAFRTARSAGVPADRRNRRCSPPFDARVPLSPRSSGADHVLFERAECRNPRRKS